MRADERPVCPYGKACYRKNPAHFKENSHPWLEKKTKSMTTAKKPTAVADYRDGPASAKPATKTEKPPKAYTSDSAGPPKEDIKKKKKEEAPKPLEYESKKPSPKIPKGGDWMDEVPPPAPKKFEKPKPAQPSTPAPSQSSSSKPSFSAPAQSQTTVSPSGKKTLKLMYVATCTRVVRVSESHPLNAHVVPQPVRPRWLPALALCLTTTATKTCVPNPRLVIV
jgi:hypothetical protein